MRATVSKFFHRIHVTHEARQVFEVAPELVNLFGCAVDDAGTLGVYPSLVAIARLHRIHNREPRSKLAQTVQSY